MSCKVKMRFGNITAKFSAPTAQGAANLAAAAQRMGLFSRKQRQPAVPTTAAVTQCLRQGIQAGALQALVTSAVQQALPRAIQPVLQSIDSMEHRLAAARR